MTEKLEATLNGILTKSIELAEKTGEFVVEQGTELLQQFFMWHMASAIFYCVLGVIMVFTGILLPRLWGKGASFKYYSGYGDYEISPKFLGRFYSDTGFGSAILSSLVGVIGGIWIALYNLHTIIYIAIAPKLYLIEYFVK